MSETDPQTLSARLMDYLDRCQIYGPADQLRDTARQLADALASAGVAPAPPSLSPAELEAMRRCSHIGRTGGSDYSECLECGLMWDYRRETPEHALDRLGASSPAPPSEWDALKEWGENWKRQARINRDRAENAEAAMDRMSEALKASAASPVPPSNEIVRRKPCPQDEADHKGCATCEGAGAIYVIDGYDEAHGAEASSGQTCPDCGAANPQRPLDHREGCSEASAGVVPAPSTEHTCHGGMNPPFPYPCAACATERAEASAPSPVVPRKREKEENQGLLGTAASGNSDGPPSTSKRGKASRIDAKVLELARAAWSAEDLGHFDTRDIIGQLLEVIDRQDYEMDCLGQLLYDMEQGRDVASGAPSDPGLQNPATPDSSLSSSSLFPIAPAVCVCGHPTTAHTFEDDSCCARGCDCDALAVNREAAAPSQDGAIERLIATWRKRCQHIETLRSDDQFEIGFMDGDWTATDRCADELEALLRTPTEPSGATTPVSEAQGWLGPKYRT